MQCARHVFFFCNDNTGDHGAQEPMLTFCLWPPAFSNTECRGVWIHTVSAFGFCLQHVARLQPWMESIKATPIITLVFRHSKQQPKMRGQTSKTTPDELILKFVRCFEWRIANVMMRVCFPKRRPFLTLAQTCFAWTSFILFHPGPL